MIREKKPISALESDEDYLLRRALNTSSSLARKSLLFTAMKPILDTQLHLGTIVDIGCGIGAPAEFLSGHYDRYIGVDRGEKVIEAAKLFNRNNSKAEFVVQELTNSVLMNNTADVVLAVGALHHMSNLDSVLETVLKIAKPNAYFVVIEPQFNSPIGLVIRLMRKFLDQTYLDNQIHYTDEYLKSLLIKNGIRDVNVEYHGFFSATFAQIDFRPQYIFIPISLATIVVDGILDNYLPHVVKKFAVNTIIRGTFPDEV
ncbi:class I SAM-dependent methyltransferase [candidate division CSSED10-310 bacterium]|uniref:Class I SAM-dependent methyltransferase n=1 Tax=candidate division CSSED10-310 bacterium TaxID=2855610 RepID=A0ABV6Z137_UNCC1